MAMPRPVHNDMKSMVWTTQRRRTDNSRPLAEPKFELIQVSLERLCRSLSDSLNPSLKMIRTMMSRVTGSGVRFGHSRFGPCVANSEVNNR